MLFGQINECRKIVFDAAFSKIPDRVATTVEKLLGNF